LVEEVVAGVVRGNSGEWHLVRKNDSVAGREGGCRVSCGGLQ
jgi:hypothetical protein